MLMTEAVETSNELIDPRIDRPYHIVWVSFSFFGTASTGSEYTNALFLLAGESQE